MNSVGVVQIADQTNLVDNARGAEILHLVSNVGFGGVAVQARDIGGEFVRRGLARHVLLLKASEANEATRRWYEESTPIDVIDERLERSTGLSRIWLHQRDFAGRPEQVFHFHCYSHEYIDWRLFLAARLAGKTIVATLHHTVNWTQNRFTARAGQHLAWWCAWRLITTTNAGKRLVAQRAPENKLRVVPCGLPVNQSSPRDRSAARANLGIAPSDFVVVSICRISRNKGIFDLAEAITRLAPSHPSLRLLVVGDGLESSELKSLYSGHPNIRIMGYLSDVSEVLAGADLFAMPSYEEGFGLVYVEAAQYSLPSIAPRIDTVAEVVEDGNTGWLVTPGVPAELDAALIAALSQPSEVLRRGRNALTGSSGFGLSLVANNLQRIYEEIGDGVHTFCGDLKNGIRF